MTAKKTRLRARSNSVRLPDPHPYFANGISTGPGFPEGCAYCPLPMGHEVHIPVPDNPISDIDARVAP
jgi:hypothetical protein